MSALFHISRALLVTSALLLLGAPVARAGKPPLHPNSTRYSDASPAAATGRSGSATLTMRALYSPRRQTTEVEMTTGALDTAAAAPGEITKVKLRPHDLDGDRLWNRNFKGDGTGVLSLTFPDLRPGFGIDAQANLRGIDGNRTSVVDAAAPVRIRPDLTVTDLTLPPQGRKGIPVNVVALVRERNLDVGATANCLLRIDGVEVDRASGIWIDRAGSVSCAFTHRFDAVGTYRVEVAVAGARPADDDPINDARATNITILDDVRLSWSANLWRTEGLGHLVTYSTWFNSRSFEYMDSLNVDESLHVSAWSSTRLRGPLTVLASESSGSTSTSTLNRAGVVPQQTWDDSSCGGARGMEYDPLTQVTFRFETLGCPGSEVTNITYDRYGGQAIFYSRRYMEMWFGNEPPVGFWSPLYTTVNPVRGLLLVSKTVGSHGLSLSVEGEGSRQLADIVVPTYRAIYSFPGGVPSCVQTTGGPLCMQHTGIDYDNVSGFATWSAP